MQDKSPEEEVASDREQDIAVGSAGRGSVARLGVLLAFAPLILAGICYQGDRDLPPLKITADRPGLIFSEHLVDYGPDPVEPQPVLQPTILLRNVTEREIKISDLEASCGCVKPQVSTMSIAPGAEERITIPIRTTGEQPGQREYSVTVHYEDTRPRAATLTVKVVLPEPQVIVEPRVLGIVGNADRAIEHAVTVSDYRTDPLLVTSATSSTPLINAAVLKRDVTEDGSRATIAVKVAAGTPPGIHRAIVQFTTDDPRNARLQVPIVLQGAPRGAAEQVTVRPPQIRIAANDPASAPILLRINVPAEWDVSHIDAFPPELNVSFDETATSSSERREMLVKVSLSDIPAGQPRDGVITLVADEGSQMVSVPVSFVWRPSL